LFFLNSSGVRVTHQAKIFAQLIKPENSWLDELHVSHNGPLYYYNLYLCSKKSSKMIFAKKLLISLHLFLASFFGWSWRIIRWSCAEAIV